MTTVNQPVPNHTVDTETGFLESNGYVQAFDANKKTAFLKLFYDNGLKFWRTCAELGVKGDTVHKHAALDPVFKQAIEEVKRDFYDELEGISRINALNPKSVIERIFQLKAAFPSKYGDNKQAAAPSITINIDAGLIEQARMRSQALDVQEIVDNQQMESASKEAADRQAVSDPDQRASNT